MKATWYYRNVVELKRPYLTDVLCEEVMTHAVRIEMETIPETGEQRIRYWAFAPELQKFVRVVTLIDGETVHNAFPDRSFKP